MKRLKLMMVAVLGIIALLLSFAPMPAATSAPIRVVEAEAGSNMSIGTEVVLSNNTVATYLGKTSDGNYKWQATFEGPKYLDDLKTPIDCRWEYDIDKEEWNSCANLFTATVKDDRVTVEYQGIKMNWQPQLEIGSKQQTENGTTLLPVDLINENYLGNTLQWDYGNGITRNLRIIEGMLIEYYTICELPTGNITIKTNTNKDAGFVWTRPEVAWDANYTPVDLIVDGDDVTLTLEALKNATLPITIDPDTTFTTSSSDGHIEEWGGPYYNDIWMSTSGTVHNSSAFWIGQSYVSSGNYYCILRGFVFFNTASLPIGSIITNTTLSLHGCSDASKTDFDVVVQTGIESTYPHNPLVETDYCKENYDGDGGSFNTASFTTWGYNNITLNADGRSWIKKGGWTKFALRSQKDISGSPPGEDEGIRVYSYEYGEGYRPKLVVTYEILPPLERYAPVLYFHPEEGYYTDSTYSMMNESNLTLWNESAGQGEVIGFSPTEADLASNNTIDHYMDIPNSEPYPFRVVGEWGAPPADPPEPSRFVDYNLTVYGRQVVKTYQGTDYVVLQYWFFYPYNKWYNCHEGDWERIQIICDKATQTPINVTFGQHGGGETVPWHGGVSLVAETHPKVFVGWGSHSSWATDGLHILDRTSANGTVLYPEYIDGSGTGGIDQQPYALEDISSEPSWVEWLGKWGQYVNETWRYLGACGVDSPANVVINGINVWDDPIAWANDPGSSFIVGTATGPVTGSVRLHAYDSSGNHTGLNETGGIETEIPGTYFYVPASNQSDAELMWIYTEENLTFTLEADEDGECNFSFARCFEGEITTNYTHIQVTENTTAKVDTGEGNPLLLMELDFDSDGVADEYKFPDSNSTLKGQVNFTGRYTPPNDTWIEPFVVKLFEPGNLTNVLWTGVATTNNTGVFTIDNIPPGTYDIGIKNWTCLSELVTNVTVGVNEIIEVDFGTTREGDANNDDWVTISDRTLLYTAWGTHEGDDMWNPNCDFNRDGCITLTDRTIMYANWGQSGDLAP